MGKVIFISYRRDDSSAMARSLREDLLQSFGDAVFMDVDEVRVGDTWPATLDNALVSASVLLAVIGPSWLRIADAYGRRRLDLPGDWVRTEIERSLMRPIPVVPVLVGKATLPPRDGLPASIRTLNDQQPLELREAHWKSDLLPLIDRLTSPPLSFQRVGERVPVPQWRPGRQPDVLPRMLTAGELDAMLADLPSWRVTTSPLPGEYPKVRTELKRAFRFTTFDQALDFMRAAAPFINERNHHPRWENVFRTVTVWLSTWDTGHVVSRLDCDLAKHLDSLYERMQQPTA